MAKGKVLVVGSSADTFELKDGRKEPIGYYLNELAIPGLAVVDAGYEIVLATPSGNTPLVDRHSVSTEHFGGSQDALQRALDFVGKNPAMQTPRSIRAVIAEGVDQLVGIFLPGGHPPMVDLMQDPDLGEVLRHFHAEGKTTALLCHAPIAAIAAMPQARAFRQAIAEGRFTAAREAARGWQYTGYRMTVFSNDEEHYAEESLMGGGKVPFYAHDALQTAGGYLQSRGFFQPNVIEDRELITGQNPPSDHAMAEALVKALDRRSMASTAA